MRRFAFTVTIILSIILRFQSSQPPDLDFQLSAERSTYYTFEPLSLKMEITNRGESPIEAHFNLLTFDYPSLKLFYRKKGAEFTMFYSRRVGMAQSIEYRPGRKLMIEPGGQVSTTEVILYDTRQELMQKDRFVLSEPGEYEFQATFQYLFEGPSKIVRSHILLLKVLKAPEAEREALRRWKDKALALTVQGDDVSIDATRKLLLLRREFPNSLYAVHARSAGKRILEELSEEAKIRELSGKGKAVYELLRQQQ